MRRQTETRRDQIARYIAAFVEDHHNAPAAREIAREFSIDHKAVLKHINKLIEEGRAKRVEGRLMLCGAEYIPPPLN